MMTVELLSNTSKLFSLTKWPPYLTTLVDELVWCLVWNIHNPVLSGTAERGKEEEKIGR